MKKKVPRVSPAIARAIGLPDFKAIPAVRELVRATYESAIDRGHVTRREIRAARVVLEAMLGRPVSNEEVDDALSL